MGVMVMYTVGFKGISCMSIRGVGNAKSLGLHCINSKIVKFIMPVSIAKVLLSLVEFSLEPGTRTLLTGLTFGILRESVLK